MGHHGGIAGPLARVVLGVLVLGSLALSGVYSAQSTQKRNLAGPDCIHVSCADAPMTSKQHRLQQPTPAESPRAGAGPSVQRPAPEAQVRSQAVPGAGSVKTSP